MNKRKTFKEDYMKYLNKKVYYLCCYLKEQKGRKYNRLTNEKKMQEKQEYDMLEGTIVRIPSSKRRNNFDILLEGSMKILNANIEFVEFGLESLDKNVHENVNAPSNNEDNISENGAINTSNDVGSILSCNNEIEHENGNKSINNNDDTSTNVSSSNMDNGISDIGLQEDVNVNISINNHDNLNTNVCVSNIDTGNSDIGQQEDAISSGEEFSDEEKLLIQDRLDIEQEVEEKDVEDDVAKENKATLESFPERTSVVEECISEANLRNLKWNLNGTIEKDATDAYKNQPRIKLRSILDCRTPVEVFLYMFPDSLFNLITTMSNKYREQKEYSFKEITKGEIITYVGLLIARSLHPWKNGVKNHWRTRSEGIMFI